MPNTPAHARHLSIVSMPGTWLAHPPTRLISALYPRLAHDKHTRPGASSQHCIHAWHMVSTPAHARHLSVVSMPGTWYASSQHCIHACHMVSTPARARHLSTGPWLARQAPPPTRVISAALYPCLPHGKHTRPRASSQHCRHAWQMISTPTHARHLSMCPRLAHAKHTCPRTSSQHCIC